MHCVLIKWHPMLSADGHTDLMPVPPPVVVQPNPWHPHIVGHVLNGWWLGKVESTVTAMNVDIVYMGSDIANGIPHVPVPPTHFLLALLYTGFSGSKSHFGPASVRSKQGPIGAALAIIVNPNLNCMDVVPLPTGWVCAPNTVVAGMTLGDILGGIFAMAFDMLLSFALNKIGGTFANAMKGRMAKLLAGPLFQFFVGSPLGKNALDVIKFVTPESWHDTLNGLSHLPGFPGYVGTLSGYPADGARWLGNKLGDAITGAETPTDRLWGRPGSDAAAAAPSTVNQPAPTDGVSPPTNAITNNPSVQDF